LYSGEALGIEESSPISFKQLLEAIASGGSCHLTHQASVQTPFQF
jgi:hypothetical protein